MFLKIKREIRSHPTVHIALAIYLAWLPVVVVNAFIIVCMDSRVDVSERLLHHLYDAGQILVIAGMVWALLMLLGRGRWFTGHRILVLASLVAWGLSFALMYSDLENFVERHGERVPWRHLFATVAAGGLVGTGIVARWIGRTALWWIGGLIGIVVMIVNHQILELAYPGVHTLLILGAVILGSVSKVRTEYFGRGDVLCGFGEPRKYRVFSSVRRSRRVHCPARKTTGGLLRQSLVGGSLADRQWRWMGYKALPWLIGIVSLVSCTAYIAAPSSVVRSELFRSTGSIGARLAARLWMAMEDGSDARPIAVDSSIRKFAILYGGRYKVILNLKNDTRELYDLKRDRGEKQNLADNPKFRPPEPWENKPGQKPDGPRKLSRPYAPFPLFSVC